MIDSFSEKILDITKSIPRGRVMTYGELARRAGFPGAARAVGNALNKNEHPIVIPCHRVVRSDGSVGGYAFGSARKIELLEGEGVRIKEGRIVDLSKFLL